MGALPRMTLRYKGLFDFDGLYAAVIDWAKNYGYMWHEQAYKHKVPSSEGAEQEFKWILTKTVTEYIHYTITIDVHTWEMRDVVVEKKELTNARINIYMFGSIKSDPHGIFKGGKLAKKLSGWYDKLLARDIDAYTDQLYYRTWDLHAMMKKFLDLQTKKYAYKGYLGEN